MKKRLIHMFVSNGMTQGIAVLSQLTLLPILLSIWGKELYAEWLVISTVPAYLAGSDLGFGFALGNDLAMKAASGAFEEAKATYRSAWMAVLTVTGIVAALFVSLTAVLPFCQWLHIQAMPRGTAIAAVDFLGLQILVIQNTGMFRAALRAEKKYVTGNYIANCVLLGQFLAIVSAAKAGWGPGGAAASSFSVAALGSLTMFLASLRLAPWLRLGFGAFDMSAIRRLIGPGLAQNGFYLVNALNLQGSVLVIDTVMGPPAALAFNTARTLCRVVNQLTNMVEVSFGPEISIAVGASDMPLARRLHQRASQLSTWTGIFFSVVLAIVGPTLYHVWTRGKIHLDTRVFMILLLAQIANGIYYGSLAVPMAVNRQVKLVLPYLVLAFVILGATVLGVHVLGLEGAAIATLASELITIGIVVPYACSLIGDAPSEWSRRAFSTNFGWLMPQNSKT